MNSNQVILESILDLNSNNVWYTDEANIAQVWEASKKEDNFVNSEEKLLNIIRLGYDVVHYDPSDPRDAAKYENGEWQLFSHINPARGSVAIRKKHVTKITDLTYENIKHITPATMLELIDRNFGGGWDSIQLRLKDIIESAFEVSTSMLPASRMHAPGSLLEKKKEQGFDVLEIEKGTWIEAIFIKKKEPTGKLRCVSAERYDEEGMLIRPYDEEEPNDDMLEETEDEENENEEEELYGSSYSPEAEIPEEDVEEEGLSIDGE